MNIEEAVKQHKEIYSKIPRHVAFIMDGNGRWAVSRGLTRSGGHEAGVNRIRPILDVCRLLDIEVISLYAFSTENWNRPQDEVDTLMFLLGRFIDQETPDLLKNKVRVRFIGRRDRVPALLREKMEQAEDVTSKDYKHIFNVCLDYGSRDEILTGVGRMLEDAAAGELDPKSLTPELFSSYLFTAGQPDPDLLIRTSGERRISNFLLWQIAYAEIIFHPRHWPEFSQEDFLECLEDFAGRERRFGQIKS